MQVRLAALCDLVQTVEHGKSNLLGVFTRFTVTALPAKLKTFYLFAQVAASAEGELVPGKTSITFELLNGSGDLIAGPEGGPIPSESRVDMDTWLQIILRWENVEVKDAGAHRISIKQDGKEVTFIGADVEVKDA